MVVLHIKKGSESMFLYNTFISSPVEDTIQEIVMIHNGCCKINRICSEIGSLIEHGAYFPLEMHGLTDDQIEELKLKDEWGEKNSPSGGSTFNKDPFGRRNGHRPNEAMQNVLKKAVTEAKGLISKELINSKTPLTSDHIYDAINILRGAVMIVYPCTLPSYDPIRKELENQEDISGTQDEKLIVDPANAQLWFAGKELQCGKKLSDYLGTNDKTKVIVKLQKKGSGAPAREPLMSEEDRKALMLAEFKRREELEKLRQDDNDGYLNSEWADTQQLKKSFQGLQNIRWKPTLSFHS